MTVNTAILESIEEIVINSTYLRKNDINHDLEINLLGISVTELPYMVILIEKKFDIDFIKLIEKEKLLNYSIREIASIVAQNASEERSYENDINIPAK